MKGVTKNTQKVFTHIAFKETLLSKSVERAVNYCIKLDNQQLFSSRMNTICLSIYDDKRILFKNGTESLPYIALLLATFSPPNCRQLG